MTNSISEIETLNLYAAIMEEIKIRIDAINYILVSPDMTVAPIRREMGYLQLRMICELVALACLVAHGDIQATRSSDMRKAYAADAIMSALEKLHPDYFPHAHNRIEQGERNYRIDEKVEPYLTKSEFLKLVRKCGSMVHRGSLKKLFHPNIPIENNLNDVAEYASKLVRLLESHHILKRDGRVILCILNSNIGRVSTAMARSPFGTI